MENHIDMKSHLHCIMGKESPRETQQGIEWFEVRVEAPDG